MLNVPSHMALMNANMTAWRSAGRTCSRQCAYDCQKCHQCPQHLNLPPAGSLAHDLKVNHHMANAFGYLGTAVAFALGVATLLCSLMDDGAFEQWLRTVAVWLFAMTATGVLATACDYLYPAGVLKYLCQLQPDKQLAHLSSAEIQHRYQRACHFGVLSVLFSLVSLSVPIGIAIYACRSNQVNGFTGYILAVLLLVEILFIAQIVDVVSVARNVRATTKEWHEARKRNHRLSFAGYANLPRE